jgi:hypothetical protein
MLVGNSVFVVFYESATWLVRSPLTAMTRNLELYESCMPYMACNKNILNMVTLQRSEDYTGMQRGQARFITYYWFLALRRQSSLFGRLSLCLHLEVSSRLAPVSLQWVLIGYIQFIMRSVLNLKRRTRETCKTRHSLIFTGQNPVRWRHNNKISRGVGSTGVLQKCKIQFAMANI